MSQPPRKVTMAPPRPQLNRENFGQVLSNSKRKISQTKGEIFDNLNDRINIELQAIHDGYMEVYDRLELAQAENKHLVAYNTQLETNLAKYEPTKGKQIQKTEKIDVSDHVTKGLKPPKP